MMIRSILAILVLTLGTTVYGNCQSTVLTDYQSPYSYGPYTAYVDPYAASSRNYIQGTDYVESITHFHGPSFPNNSLMTWQWPALQSGQYGILNFMSLTYGNYDYTVPETLITPQTIGKITTLTETHNFSLGGNLNGFDLIDDIFLTSQGTQGAEAGIQTHEIEIALHSPPYAQEYVLDSYNAGPTVVQLGTFTGSGITWVVADDKGRTPNDILFMPQNLQDVPNQAVDISRYVSVLGKQGRYLKH